MKNSIGAIESSFEDVSLRYVPTDIVYSNARVFQGIVQIFEASADEIIVDNDFTYVFLDEKIDSVRTD